VCQVRLDHVDQFGQGLPGRGHDMMNVVQALPLPLDKDVNGSIEQFGLRFGRVEEAERRGNAIDYLGGPLQPALQVAVNSEVGVVH